MKLDPDDNKGHKTESLFQLAVFEARVRKNGEPLEDFMAGEPGEKYLQPGYGNIIDYYRREKYNEKIIQTYEVAVTKIPEDANLMNDYAWFNYSIFKYSCPISTKWLTFFQMFSIIGYSKQTK